MNEARPGLVLYGAGRMGRLLHDTADSAGFDVVAVVSRHRPDWQGASPWRDGLAEVTADRAAVLIDFSLPPAVPAAAEWCARHGVALVSGTTGLSAEHRAALARAGQRVPVLWASNFSIGINLCLGLVTHLGRSLDSVEAVRVTDVHHVSKKDAPSGTALALGAAAAPHAVEYDSVREGEVVGYHEVRFVLPGEEVVVAHNARDRGIYARGALRAARWLLGRPPGLYAAHHWLEAGHASHGTP